MVILHCKDICLEQEQKHALHDSCDDGGDGRVAVVGDGVGVMTWGMDGWRLVGG